MADIRAIGILLAILILVSCHPTRIRHHRESDQEGNVKETTDVRLDNPADISRINVPGLNAEIAPNHQPPKVDVAMKGTVRWSMIGAIACAVAAVAILAARKWFTLIPTNLPVGLAIIAGLLYVGPTILDRHSGKLVIGACAWGAWTLYSWRHNCRLKREDLHT